MQTPDINKIDLLLQLSLLTAGQEDEWTRRELGPIHLIKYVYLADLEFSKHYNGETFTGLPWRFYKFGPWAEECYNRIEPALLAIGAKHRVFSHPKYEDDIERWSLQDDGLFEQIYEQLPLQIAGVIQNMVHKFGADTDDLLDYAYKTYPMLRAAPNEPLNFIPPDFIFSRVHETDNAGSIEHLTDRQVKKRKEQSHLLKQRVKLKLKNKKAEKGKRYYPPLPRYDEVYFEGIKNLDSIAGSTIEPLEGTAELSDKIWKSKARFDPDVP